MAWPRAFLACLLAAAILFALAIPPVATASTRTRMVKTINHVRSWGNIHGLRYSPRLSRRAAGWARHLLRTGVMAHSSSARGEVIEWHSGSRPRIRYTVGAWLRSPGHRNVMLSRSYSRAGAGRAVGYVHGRRMTVWVVRFGGSPRPLAGEPRLHLALGRHDAAGAAPRARA